MSNTRQLIVIGALVVFSGLGAAVTANSAINGAIGTMDDNTAQTGSDSLTNAIQTPDSEQVITVTTPDGVQSTSHLQTQTVNESNGIQDDAVTPVVDSESTTPQPQRPTFIHQQTTSVPTEIQSSN